MPFKNLGTNKDIFETTSFGKESLWQTSKIKNNTDRAMSYQLTKDYTQLITHV